MAFAKMMVLAASSGASSSSGLSESMKTALTTAFQTVSDNVMDIVGIGLPFALGILGSVMAIVIGIGVFKRLTAKA